MKIVVFAYSQLGYMCLQALLEEGHKVLALYTHEDQQREHIWFQRPIELAQEHHVPCFTPQSPNTPETISHIQYLKPDAIFSFYYRSLICDEILSIPTIGAFNMHGSLLPKYRGCAPVNWAILNGETQTGVTLHYMVKAADAGDIVDQEVVDILHDDHAGSVSEKLNTAAVHVLKRQLSHIASGTHSRTIQKNEDATYFRRRTPQDGEIHWDWSALQIHNLVRALTPIPQYPGAYIVQNCENKIVSESTLCENDPPLPPGSMAEATDNIFACGPHGTERIKLKFLPL